MAQFYLIASLVALASGPMLFAVSRRSHVWLRVADGFVFTAICGLVAVGILPLAVEAAGFWALVPAVAGFFLPRLFERNRVHNHRVHAFTMQAVVLGLTLDAVIDGVGLAAPGAAANAHTLPMAILVHRVPVSVAIWWLIRPEFGLAKALISLALVAFGTLGGYALGESAAWLNGPLSGYVVGLIGGFLLHVVLHGFPGHQPLGPGTSRVQRYGEGIGALLGIAVLVWTLSSEAAVHGHGHGSNTGAWQTLYQLGLESAPSLLLAYVLSGLVYAFVPLAATAWMSRGNAMSQALRGMAFGLPIPICSCGVVPLFRTLTQRGVPPAAAMAFLIATPELGLDALILTLPLLGWQFMLVRLTAAAFVALIVGWAISHLVTRTRASGSSDCSCSQSDSAVLDAGRSGSLRHRAREALRLGFIKVVDDTAPWIVAGLLIATAAVPLLEAPLLRQLPDWAEVLAFAALGLPIYVCASGATPIAAVLIAHGVSPGAALAFLLTGPATNVTTFGVVADAYGRRVALLTALLIATLTISLGLATNALLPAGALAAAQSHSEHAASLLPQMALLILALLFLASLVRQGPRSFVHHLIPIDDTDNDHHDHGHSHNHDHDHGHPHSHDSCCHGEPKASEPNLITIKEFS